CVGHSEPDAIDPSAGKLHMSEPQLLHVPGASRFADTITVSATGHYTSAGLFDEHIDLNIEGYGTDLSPVQARALAELLTRVADMLEGSSPLR
ncbi:hypothetical protein ACWDYH_24805, partial [Nocardia goodfellowii]